jgi:hypothetical protein
MGGPVMMRTDATQPMFLCWNLESLRLEYLLSVSLQDYYSSTTRYTSTPVLPYYYLVLLDSSNPGQITVRFCVLPALMLPSAANVFRSGTRALWFVPLVEDQLLSVAGTCMTFVPRGCKV